MIISHKHKFIFIAVPKTGSQTVRKLFRSFLDENDEEQCSLLDLKRSSIPEIRNMVHGHQTAKEIKNAVGEKIFNEYFKFAFVRDPIQRFISTYFFLKRNHRYIEEPTYENLYDFYMKSHNKLHLLPQHNFIYGDKGELLVDYIGYTCDMNKSLNYICSKLGFNMFSNVPILNKTDKKEISINYEIKKLVYGLYYEDYAKIIFSQKEFTLDYKNTRKFHGMLCLIGKINLEGLEKNIEKSDLYDTQRGLCRLTNKYMTRKQKFSLHKHTENIILTFTSNDSAGPSRGAGRARGAGRRAPRSAEGPQPRARRGKPYLRYTDKKLYYKFQKLVDKVLKSLQDIFNYENPVVIKLMFAKLLPRAEISTHIDKSEILRIVQRIHIPLVTNSDVTVTINNKKYKMETGKIYNFNNTLSHSVVNNSDMERVHLIIDYVDQKVLDLLNIKIEETDIMVF
jgi:hypothetical protein